MSKLSPPNHRRGRSSSTTTAIRPPCLTSLSARSVAASSSNSRPRSSSLSPSGARRSMENKDGDGHKGKAPPSNISATASNWAWPWPRLTSSTPSESPNIVCSTSTSSLSSQLSSPTTDEGSSLSSWAWPPTPIPVTSNRHPPQAAPRPQSAPLPISADKVESPSGYYSSILLVILLFPLSTICILAALYTLPIRLPNTEGRGLPRTLTELKMLAMALKSYSDSGSAELLHVIGVLSITALWKHAWSIPGSAVLNVLSGALLSPVLATLLQTTLTTIGSLLSSQLAKPLTPLITRFFPSALALTRAALEPSLHQEEQLPSPTTDKPTNKSVTPTWARLSVLRLVGVVPWSGINVACGVCGVNVSDAAIGAFIGTLPWTAVTCQIGDILQSLATPSSALVTTSDQAPAARTLSEVLASPQIIIKLVILTLLSLAPILGRDRLSKLVEPKEKVIDDDADERLERRRQKHQRHRKRFSKASVQEWWRRSISLTRPGIATPPSDEENVELMNVTERDDEP